MFFLLVAGAIFVIFYGVAKNIPSGTQETASPTPARETPASEITSMVKSKSNLLVKILNGTGRFEETDKVKKAMADAGFNIAFTENALNLYDQTIVYYQPASENFAQEIVGLLSTLQAKSQKFSQETKYDIVVVIGTK